MTEVVIPINNQPNQTLTTTVNINGENKNFRLFLVWNGCGKYWEFDLFDADNDQQLLSRIPLVGNLDGNIIPQYSYKGIGEARIINVSGSNNLIPNQENLGTDYFLVWSDND